MFPAWLQPGNTVPRWMEGWQPGRVLWAFDADLPGDQSAQALANPDPGVQRCRAESARDGNEISRRETCAPEPWAKPANNPGTAPSRIVSVRTRRLRRETDANPWIPHASGNDLPAERVAATALAATRLRLFRTRRTR